MLYQAGQTPNDVKQNLANTGEDESEDQPRESKWLELARDAFKTSEDYFESSVRRNVEIGLAHFANRHAPGSKYFSEQYKHRSKGFRPKTRSIVRKNEATAIAALFSTNDVVAVTAQDTSDEAQKVSAEINQELLQYRLENTVPWYLICVGAYQDALKSGVCISHQFWDYREVLVPEPSVNPETGEQDIDEAGQPVMSDRVILIKDSPAVELRPIENVRLSPGCDWEDPINSSPYLIDMIPMEIGEVQERAKPSAKSRIPWYEVTDAELSQGLTTNQDSTRAQREHGQEDSKEQRHSHTEFDTVWVHRNIVRKDGLDYVFYTLGDFAMLSDPIPLMMEYPHLSPGERPYVMGLAVAESHKVYPDSLALLSAATQQEANEINNQRRDNVALVLNRRYFARRGAQIDIKSLMRNVPGGVTMMDDINKDIRMESPPDVTSSSYQEQERVDLDFDEIAGSFSQASVAGNRKLNETVGGMELLNKDADQVTEYQLRTWVLTWVEPVLKQLIKLEQRHETDDSLLQLVGKQLDLWQRYGVDQVTDRMLQGSMTVNVDVGFGATDPTQRVKKLTMGLNTVLQYKPEMALRLDPDEIAKEVFGALGYQNADRFFPQLTEEQQAQMQGGQTDPRLEVEKFKAQASMELEQARQAFEQQALQFKAQSEQDMNNVKLTIANMDLQRAMVQLADEKELSLESIKAQLGSLAMKERSANERFMFEMQHAKDIGPGGGKGRGI